VPVAQPSYVVTAGLDLLIQLETLTLRKRSGVCFRQGGAHLPRVRPTGARESNLIPLWE